MLGVDSLRFFVIIIASLIPGILWVRFFHLKDRVDQEPAYMLIRTFAAGAASVGLAAMLEWPFREWLTANASVLQQLFVAFVVIGLGEELLKALAVYVAAYRRDEFNEPVDGIIYGVTAGIGFSVVENVLYTLTYGLEVAPLRALVASLAHACFSGIFGVYCGRAKFKATGGGELAKGLLLASFVHGLYDYFLIAQVLSPWAAVVLVVIIYIVLQRLLRQAVNRSPIN